MTTPLRTIDRSPTTRLVTVVPATPVQQPGVLQRRRERDFGVGYGNSSGYASDKRYASAWGQPLFRCG